MKSASGVGRADLPTLIEHGYTIGIFPMADEQGRLGWYSADPRGILELDEFHMPHRLARKLRTAPFRIQIDQAFTDVMRGCAHRASTWISPVIIEAYTVLHQRGKAHSVEAWQDHKLVGGLYGVSLGGAFFGESMFAEVPDSSKACLVFLVERLKERGYTLLDCQMVTAHMARFGARLISAPAYQQRLQQALKLGCTFA
ncbi:MAG TPA: leucyl/phenylalanyl-tRNA--protein transferase [Candidatus Xenobia bacterium]|jgi:leucyl/phenylalanyl-tRNA--protein transferase